SRADGENRQGQGHNHGTANGMDTTVVETNIHHPTDSTLLGDGVRVLTRIMKKITGRQRRQHQPRDRKAIKAVSSPSSLKLSTAPAGHYGGQRLQMTDDPQSAILRREVD